jgi:aminoglycoside 6'-N-acetyltransferase I
MRTALRGGDRNQLESEAKSILSSPTEVCFLAATESGRHVGFLEVSLRHTQNHTYGYLEGWYVAPEYKRRGIGSCLIDHAENWLLHHSVEAIFSDTDEANYTESLPAHANSGYTPIRRFTLLKKDV